MLRIGGYPLRKYGSQGQQKSFLIALKLAQYAVVAARGEKPILLQDDLFDKLDAGRVEQLLRLVADDAFGQIFITDCNPTRLRRILDRAGGDYALFTVAGGRIARAADVPGRRTDGPESASSDNPRAARAENVRTTEDESRNAPPEKAERTTGAGTPETTRETDGDAEHGRTTAGPDRKGGGA